MTENFWMELIRIIGGILTLAITGYIAIKQVKQNKETKEIKGSVNTLKTEIDGHMSKLMSVSNEVHEQKGKQEQIEKEKIQIAIPAPVPPIELKIGKLEVEMKPPVKPGKEEK